MFSTNSYAKIRKIIKDEKYHIDANISISHKNKITDKYEVDFMGSVTFIGNALKNMPKENDRIKITQCGVQNCYIKNDKIEFLKIPKYLIFDYELQDRDKKSEVSIKNIETQMSLVEDGDLPF